MRPTVSMLFFLALGMAGADAAAQDSRPNSEKAALIRKADAAFEDENWSEAVIAYKALLEIDEKNPVAWHHLGYALHSQNKLDEALAAHLRAAEFPRTRAMGLYNAGCVHALRNEKDKAFEYLLNAAEAGFGQVEALDSDSDLTNLRSDPRFAKLVDAVKNAQSRGAASVQVFSNPGERKTSRLAWFNSQGSPGQVLVSFGAVTWKDAYEKHAAAPEFANKRWRLGRDFWTTLDTNIDLTVGDKQVPPGDYYLTLERRGSGDFVLAMIPAAEVRKARLDAFQAGKTKGGIEVLMKHEPLSSAETKLDIALSVDGEDKAKGAVTIKFGPHVLCAPVTYHLGKP